MPRGRQQFRRFRQEVNVVLLVCLHWQRVLGILNYTDVRWLLAEF